MTNTKQIVLIQADILAPETYMSNYKPGVWWKKKFLTDAEKAASFWTTNFNATFDDLEEDRVTISSFAVGTDRYQRRTNKDDLSNLTQAFSYDTTNQDLYVTFMDKKQAWQFPAKKSGEANNWVNQAQVTELGPTFSIYGEDYADPRLTGTINDSQSLDKLEDQKFNYDSYNFELINDDGELDDLRAQIINQVSRILLAEVPDTQIATIDDFALIRYGEVTDVTFTETRVRVQVTDPRKRYEQAINPKTFNTTDWPSIDDKFVGKHVPLLLGRTIIPAIQVDTTKFLIADTQFGALNTIHDVFVDGVSAVYTSDTVEGTVTIPSYTSGDVTADVTGLDISNVVDQIMFFFSSFASLSETSEFFDLDQVQTMRDKNYTGAYYIGTKGKKLNDVLSELSSGINMWVYPKDGGIYGFRDITPEIPTYEISADELASFPGRNYDNGVFVSTLSIQYKPDYVEDETLTIFDDSLEDQAIENHSIDRSGEFTSTVDNDTNAQTLLTAMYEQRIFAPELLKLEFTDTLPFKLSDYVIFTHKRVNDPLGQIEKVIIPRSRYRVIQASRINKNCILRRIDEYPTTIDNLGILDFNGNPANLVYLDFNNASAGDIISFGEVS